MIQEERIPNIYPPMLSFSILFSPPSPSSQQPQPPPQPVRIIPSQSAQPTSLPKPVPSVQHAARPPRPPHTPHAASLPTCPGRGKMAKFLSPDEMTSRDYYFDSYAHFGIHEVATSFFTITAAAILMIKLHSDC